MKGFAAHTVVLLLTACAASEAAASSVRVQRSSMLAVPLSVPAERFHLGPVTRKTSLKMGDGLLLNLGPRTARITRQSSQGDDSSGWNTGPSCARNAEVLVWRGPEAIKARGALLHGARRGGWSTINTLGATLWTLHKGTSEVNGLLVSYQPKSMPLFVAVLCQ